MELQPCPFCGCEMSINSNRDWHRPVGKHGENCVLDHDHDIIYAATPQGRAFLIEDWNRRAPLAAVPEGWRLVPEKPSVAMCIRGAVGADNEINGHAAAQVYAFMLAAAPQSKD